MRRLFLTTAIVGFLLLVSDSWAEEYFIYRDSQGRVVLSNLHPSMGATDIRTSIMKDISWEQVWARHHVEQWDVINSKLNEIEERLTEIERELKRQGAQSERWQPAQVLVGISTSTTVRRNNKP